ncbi:MAG: mechanosensitive ion channel, partial [Gemmatimonadota bacterium]|nr:mechanosensitive ion channel [Gemmatimonadota bacterium]
MPARSSPRFRSARAATGTVAAVLLLLPLVVAACSQPGGPGGAGAESASGTAAPATAPAAEPGGAEAAGSATGAVGATAQALREAIGGGEQDAAGGQQQTATGGQESGALEQAGQRLQNLTLRILAAILLLVLTQMAVSGLVWLLDRLAERSAERRLFFKRLAPILRVVLWTIAIVFVVRVVFDLGREELIAAGAAAGVAVGFAAQDILKNIFGGLVIILDQPFQVGDKVEIGETYGEVVSIGLRSTRITTPDDSTVSVPNARIVESQVSNANTGALDCQVVVELFLPGWADEARAKRIAHEAAATSKYIYLKKPIVVLVKEEFHTTFVTRLKVKAYVLDARFEFQFASDVTERARAGFREAGLLPPWHGAQAWLDFPG